MALSPEVLTAGKCVASDLLQKMKNWSLLMIYQYINRLFQGYDHKDTFTHPDSNLMYFLFFFSFGPE